MDTVTIKEAINIENSEEKTDILSREQFVGQIVDIIKGLLKNNKSCTFAINGEWGCGKTFVLDMLEKELKDIQNEETSSDKYLIFKYNCWQYDYYEEPLIAIVAAMLDSIEMNNVSKKLKITIKNILKTIGSELIKAAEIKVKEKTGIDVKNIEEKIKDIKNKTDNKVKEIHQYDKYFAFKEALNCLEETLKKLSKDEVIIFIVDELDRCLPEYAIKVLERLHHLTEGLNNTITILSMDKSKLNESIKQIFGFETEEYLKKFIDFEIPLDMGKINDKFKDKYKSYISLFDEELLKSFLPDYNFDIDEYFTNLFHGIGVRTQEKLIKKAELIHNMLFSDKKDYSFMCMELFLIVLIDYYKENLHLEDINRNILPDNPFGKSLGDKSLNLDTIMEIFITSKFKNIKYKKTVNENIIILNEKLNLYSFLLFYWGNLRIRNNIDYNIIVDDTLLYNLIKDNINFLQQYNCYFNIIK